MSQTTVTSRAGVGRPTAFSASSRSMITDEPPAHVEGLARKLTCSVAAVVFTGVCLILLLQVGLGLRAVPDWGQDTESAMVELEKQNIIKLATDKAEFVSEIFGRNEEAVLQAQAFAEQALLENPETMIVEHYLFDAAGLEERSEETWERSVWFVPGYAEGEDLTAGSTLAALQNRTSLMDVPFRGMQRQHLLLFMAAPDVSSSTTGSVPDVLMRNYAGFDMLEAGYLDAQECDSRYTDHVPTTFDPRCRVWYQDAIEDGNTDIIFTRPYLDQGSGTLIVSVAAPVFDSTDPSLLLGVVALDMDFTSEIETSITDLRVVGDDGYAYLLAAGDDGSVAVHKDLDKTTPQVITELELGVDEAEFAAIIARMTESCDGSETYAKGGDPWILSWQHETVSNGSDGSCVGGFVLVVTVRESDLLEAFSEVRKEVGHIFAVAIGIMVVLLVTIIFCTACVARALAKGITSPVNQLTGVVHTLNRRDFSQQAAGSWMVNDVSSPELVELMKAFHAMMTIVKFANITLGSGDVDVAKQSYIDALILFIKLKNDRGVGIVSNNLGNVYTLQAGELATKADGAHKAKNDVRATQLAGEANSLFADAVTSYEKAIDDAELLCSVSQQQGDGLSPLPPKDSPTDHEGDTKQDVDFDAAELGHGGGNDHTTEAALALQLANRKFNLALCLTAQGTSSITTWDTGKGKGHNPDPVAAVDRARRLILECITIAAERKDAEGDQRQVEYLLELASLERTQPGRGKQAVQALDETERVISAYRGGDDARRSETFNTSGGLASAEGSSLPAPLAVLQQRMLVARGQHSRATGDPVAAIKHWTRAIIGCGNLMDARAVRTALTGLREIAATGQHGRSFSSGLLVALNLPPGGGKEPTTLTAAIENALTRLQRQAAAGAKSGAVGAREETELARTDVDLCFLMDCTGSMQSWIDQAKNKLVDIIAQTKKDVGNVFLRVAFVGYRDFGDRKQYEGPFDFHTEAELSVLLDKLKNIKAYGGDDVPEDIAGGLDLATQLSWRSPTRLCILIADAPCHGVKYHGHGRIGDRYGDGCPKGRDPSQLLYSLQYTLGVDFYFVRITFNTDKMISVFENEVKKIHADSANKRRPVVRGVRNTEPKFDVHDLGSDDNRFLEAVVKSVKVSINLRFEDYD